MGRQEQEAIDDPIGVLRAVLLVLYALVAVALLVVLVELAADLWTLQIVQGR